MKDLKHLIYFEELLSEANNALVKQATADGKKALGYTCYFVPEVLLNLGGCFSVRLRAPGTSNTDHRYILHDQQDLPVHAQHP